MTWATALLAPDQPWSPLLVAAPLAAALASVPLGRRAALLLWALVPVTGALAALVVAQVWSHSRHAVPEVPEGDLVVIGEAIATASVHALSHLHLPPLAAIRASFLLAAAWLAGRLGDVDETLKRWPVAGSLLVAVAALIAVAIAS